MLFGRCDGRLESGFKNFTPAAGIHKAVRALKGLLGRLEIPGHWSRFTKGGNRASTFQNQALCCPHLRKCAVRVLPEILPFEKRTLRFYIRQYFPALLARGEGRICSGRPGDARQGGFHRTVYLLPER